MARQNIIFTIILIVLLSLTKDSISQNLKVFKGKFCEDLGFGWYCVDFKANGKCTTTSGHSYWKNESKGKWTSHADTIVVITFAKKNTRSDTTYFYFKSDSLYSISYEDKGIVVGKALNKAD